MDDFEKQNQGKAPAKKAATPLWSNEFLNFVSGGGEVGKCMLSVDWKNTAVGPFENWPQSLKTALSICLGSKFPMFVWWGPDLTVFYNDAYIPLAGPKKHPMFLGRPAREQWSEIWSDLKPLTDKVMEEGYSTLSENMLLYMTRKGFLEETYFTFSYSPIIDESGRIGGIINPCQESTEHILVERRLKILRDLADKETRSFAELGLFASEVLLKDPQDIPFSALYLTSPDKKNARLLCSTGIAAKTQLAPEVMDLTVTNPWRTLELYSSKEQHRIEGLRSLYFYDLPERPFNERPDAAMVLPIHLAGTETLSGFLILGLSPRLELDGVYQYFINLVCKTLTTHISTIETLEIEKKRAIALAEIDKAKTDFFSNVSHEFRTPLTLLLGPTEDALNDSDDVLSEKNKERLRMVHRNALRLQKLVNSLLDFSRIEAGRMQVRYRPVDLGQFTSEIASAFNTTMEGAGLKYEIHCDKLPQDVYVDPDLWEKIILNLVSNAYKYTSKGQISVYLTSNDKEALLSVTDTGSGIPENELPNLFKRFHRIENVQGRSQEGSGIGLALTSELVKLHGGSIKVQSQLGAGSTFTVSLPFGSQHLPKDKIFDETVEVLPGDTRVLTKQYAQIKTEEPLVFAKTTEKGFRIILADDNPDMRNYIHRILLESKHGWSVQLASNGREALEFAKAQPPDLILTDVMMPELDGFGLLNAIRNDPDLVTTPVIILSARAGEEAKSEGMEKGADDYLIKPFSGRELVARVGTHLKMSTLRKEVAEQTQANRAKSLFLANMSHEIRTPLGVMIGFAESMLDPAMTEEEREHYLKIIIRNGQHLTRVINEILDLSRIEADRLQLEKVEIPVRDFVEEIANLLDLQSREKGLQLRVVTEGVIPKTIVSDPGRLRQILINLVGNAIKFTEHGYVEIKMAYLTEESKLKFVISDTGIGIGEDERSKLFQVFSQADSSMSRKYGGSGLGLVISQKLARALGGDLQMTQSEPGKGSVFEFTIQDDVILDSKPRASVRDQLELEKPRRPLEALKVLVVEDNQDNRILICRILKGAGARVVEVENGDEAVESALTAEFDAILMDIQMPQKNGIDATAELRMRGYKKPIIAVTAHAMKGDKERCLQNGFDEFLEKPLDKGALIKTLSKFEPQKRKD